MIKVDSINGHVQHLEGFRIISAEPDGAFFRISYGRPEIGELTVVNVFYTSDYGRELFRVERTITIEVPKKWWAKLIIRKKKKAD